MRLAFAVAAHLDPEILIVDEVLAVGDFDFQRKCLGKMEEIAQGGGGRTILFVSHNMGMVRSLCSRCLYLKAGRVVADGDTEDIIDLYEHRSGHRRTERVLSPAAGCRYPLQVLEAELCNSHGQRQTSAIDQFSPINLSDSLHRSRAARWVQPLHMAQLPRHEAFPKLRYRRRFRPVQEAESW